MCLIIGIIGLIFKFWFEVILQPGKQFGVLADYVSVCTGADIGGFSLPEYFKCKPGWDGILTRTGKDFVTYIKILLFGV